MTNTYTLKSLKAYISERSGFFAPLALFVTAFGIRLYVAMTQGIISSDGVLYVKLAKMIVVNEYQKVSEYGFFSLYPFLIVAAQKIFPDWEIAGRMVSVILGSLAIVPLFLIMKRLVNGRVALAAALFYAISPRLVEYSTDVLRESSYWFFSITALWMGISGLSKRKWSWVMIILASFFSGLAICTRMEGVSVCIIIVLWSCWFFLKGELNWKRAISLMIVYFIVMPLIFFPPFFFVKNKLGRWDMGLAGSKIPVLLTQNSEKAIDPVPDVLSHASHQFKSFVDMASRHRYVIFVAEVVYKFVKAFNVIFFVLLLFGLIRRRSTVYSGGEVPFLIWCSVLFIVSFVYLSKTYYLGTRHGLLMGIPALLWSGIGFYELKDRLTVWTARTKPLMNLSKYAAIVLILIIFGFILPKTLSSNTDKAELKQAGLYLKSIGYSGSRFTGDPRLIRTVFYDDGEFVVTGDELDLQETMKFVKDNGICCILIDAMEMGSVPRAYKDNVDNIHFFERISLPGLENMKEYSLRMYKVNDRGFRNRVNP